MRLFACSPRLVFLALSVSTVPYLRPIFQVTGIPKFAAEDTSLVTTDSEGRKVTIPVPQGTPIVLNVPGLHNNRT